jgi:hypothetical protein
MTDDTIAVVTPTYRPHFELCRALNRSIHQFLPETMRHYIVVDRCDLQLFRQFNDSRTVVLTKEEILPKGFIHLRLPKKDRWIAPSRVVPIAGWLVQQIVKISMAQYLSELNLLLVDSDVVFVRNVDPAVFTRGGKTRLYTKRGGITENMTTHIAWHRNCCELLGISSEGMVIDDYVGEVVSWQKALVLQMCERVQSVTGRPWYDVVSRRLQFSEYLLYGLFVERIAGGKGVWVDERHRCLCCWKDTTLTASDVKAFVNALEDDDLALMISSVSRTSKETRAAVVALATKGLVA